MCLFALEGYREWSNRLSHPLLRPLARQAFSLLSKERSRVSRWLSLASEVEIAETLSQINVPACTPQPSIGAMVPDSQASAEAKREPSHEVNHDVIFTLDEPPR